MTTDWIIALFGIFVFFVFLWRIAIVAACTLKAKIYRVKTGDAGEAEKRVKTVMALFLTFLWFGIQFCISNRPCNEGEKILFPLIGMGGIFLISPLSLLVTFSFLEKKALRTNGPYPSFPVRLAINGILSAILSLIAFVFLIFMSSGEFPMCRLDLVNPQ